MKRSGAHLGTSKAQTITTKNSFKFSNVRHGTYSKINKFGGKLWFWEDYMRGIFEHKRSANDLWRKFIVYYRTKVAYYSSLPNVTPHCSHKAVEHKRKEAMQSSTQNIIAKISFKSSRGGSRHLFKDKWVSGKKPCFLGGRGDEMWCTKDTRSMKEVSGNMLQGKS